MLLLTMQVYICCYTCINALISCTRYTHSVEGDLLTVTLCFKTMQYNYSKYLVPQSIIMYLYNDIYLSLHQWLVPHVQIINYKHKNVLIKVDTRQSREV